MRRSSNYGIAVLSAVVMLLSGCVTPEVPYDYSALENSRPRSILVIPPVNNSVEVDAPYIFLATISRPLAEKGYYVYPVAVIDRFLKENGLPTPIEMNAIPLDKIAEHIGADAVLYVSIEDWGQKYQLVSSKTIVHSTLRLIDVNTGVLLWQARVQGIRTSDDAGAGLLGALVNAIATQVAGSVNDYTPGLSSISNHQQVNHSTHGLLHGPYFNPDTTIVWRTGNVRSEAAYDTNLLFVGRARGEIAAKTYDEKLWAEALILAQDDPQQQKEIYVELRSKQLANEGEAEEEKRARQQELASPLTASSKDSESVNNLSGTYISIMNVTNSRGSRFGKKYRKMRITLDQTGNAITGIDNTGELEIKGTREGDVINFKVDNYTKNSGTWKINANASELEGKWNSIAEGGESGTWNLTRVGSVADNGSSPVYIVGSRGDKSAATFTQVEVSGIYSSEIIYKRGIDRSSKRGYFGYRPDIEIEFQQDGNVITGVISGDRTGNIDGLIDGNIITFKYFIEVAGGAPRSGYGSWTVGDDGSSINGTWRGILGHSSYAGQWDLTKTR